MSFLEFMMDLNSALGEKCWQYFIIYANGTGGLDLISFDKVELLQDVKPKHAFSDKLPVLGSFNLKKRFLGQNYEFLIPVFNN